MFFRTITIDFLATDKCLVWQFIWAPFMERPIKQYVLQQFSLISATKRLCPPPCFDLEREWPISTLFSSFFFFSPFSFLFPCVDLERVAHINPFIPICSSLSSPCQSLSPLFVFHFIAKTKERRITSTWSTDTSTTISDIIFPPP